jgi:hypothetical protein
VDTLKNDVKNNTAIPGLKNYGHLPRRPGRKIGAEKGIKAVCFIFLPTSFCQALFRKPHFISGKPR